MSKCELHPEYARQKAKLEALLTRRNRGFLQRHL